MPLHERSDAADPRTADSERGGPPLTAVTVDCRRTPDGHRCMVVVGDDARATTHEVAVADAVLARLGPGPTDTSAAERLVRASFAYLLEREPREAILRSFDLPVIERYFPGYGGAIARYLQDDRAAPA
jgi:hypothetical protein